MIKAFADTFSNLLMGPLPGPLAHQKMAPLSRQVIHFNPADYPNAKIAAVLVLCYPKNGEITMVLTQRPNYDGVHSGQISFPGGKIEPGDNDELHTALRETEEEIGVLRQEIRVIGKLSNVYIPPSNFFVFPFVGIATSAPIFTPDSNEVAEIIEMPINTLLADSVKSTITINRPEAPFEAPCYDINGKKVWGATAIILSEVEWLLRESFNS